MRCWLSVTRLYGEMCGTDANAKDLRGALDSCHCNEELQLYERHAHDDKDCEVRLWRRSPSRVGLQLGAARGTERGSLRLTTLQPSSQTSGGVEEMRRSKSATAKTQSKKLNLASKL